ncbi:MAG: hypothetical protein HY513_04730 [Candidatus Aenigmarchaeota archaeon]|nr:hypothetical protein [Candidatus Aenigmarchaeota archaeon]
MKTSTSIKNAELTEAGLYLVPGTILQEGSIAVPWIVRPEWVGNKPKAGRKSRIVIAALPPRGYGLIHMRDPNTGWVLQTRQSRAEAERLVADEFSRHTGDSKAADLAREEVSYSYRRQKGEGKSAVYRDFILDANGPFFENAYWDGGDRNRSLGAFPLR